MEIGKFFKKIENIYLVLALIFGLIIVFITPPFQSPDEANHFKKAYLISTGDVYPNVEDDIKGNYFSQDIEDSMLHYNGYIGSHNIKYDYETFFKEQFHSDSRDYSNEKFNIYSTDSVFPLVYISPTLGIWFSNISSFLIGYEDVNVSYMLSFARMISLFITIFIMYKAIKLTPILKNTMLAIGLMPMFLFLSSTVTYDNILLSCGMLALALMFKLKFEKNVKFNWKYLIILTLLGLILFNLKTIYLFTYIILFFIPKEKYGSLKNKLLNIGVLTGAILVLTFIWKIPLMMLPEFESTNATALQIEFIFNNFGEYIKILFSSIWNQRGSHLTGAVGILGLVDTYIPAQIITLYYMLLITLPLAETAKDKYKFNYKEKIILGLLILLGIIGIHTMLYILWTSSTYKIGASFITGVQGRYFIPFLLPITLLFTNNIIKNNKFLDFIRNTYIFFVIATLIITIIMILLRYWI